MSTSPTVLIFLVDALGHDMISEETTPYLWRFASQGRLGSMRPVLGYSDAQRAALFTGKLPDQSGYWTDFRLHLGESPLRPFGNLRALDALPGDFSRRCVKFLLSKTAAPFQARATGYKSLPLYNLPFKAMPHFEPTLAGSMLDPHPFPSAPTMFDLVRDGGGSVAAVQSDVYGIAGMFKGPKAAADRLCAGILGVDPGADLVYVYLHSVDFLGHRYGVPSPRFRAVLREADAAVERVVAVARGHFGSDLETVVVSDHGLNHTERFVDYGHLLREPGFGRDYVVALDSTMVRLWYFEEAAQPRLRALVDASGHGRFLTEAELRDHGVFFPNGDFYHEVYLLRPGLSIFPNYHSYLKPLSMHAYDPGVPDQQAIAMFTGPRLDSMPAPKGLSITGVMPIVAGLLGLEAGDARATDPALAEVGA